MKKVFKLFILMIIITPLFLHATENYEESEKRANNYINGDSYHDKGKYLIYGAGTPYMFSNGTSRVDSYNTFKNGGLINVEEFELSRNGSASSYLLTGSQYWSMTKSTTGQYYIGKYKVEFADPDSMRSSRYDTRVTQFVKPKTKVTGTGKYSDPWVFQAGYNVIVMTNNTSYGKFKVDGTTTDRVEQIVPSGNDFSVDMLITNGYRYSGKDDCGFTSPVSNSSTYLIRNVNRDITCTAYFDERIFKFELKSEHNYTKEPNYKVLYYKFNDGWYTEYDTGTKKVYNKINKIEPPEITGYQFLGYTYKNSPIISSGGDLSNIDSELLDYSKDNQELTASWKDVTKPKVAITVYNYDANATNKVGTDIIDDRQLYTGDAELLVNSNKWISRSVTFLVESSDDESGIKDIVWQWNPKGSETDTLDDYSGGSNTYTSGFANKYPSYTGKGYRKGKWIVTDKEGNVTTINITVKIGNARIDYYANGGTTSGYNPVYTAYGDPNTYRTRFGTTKGSVSVSRSGWDFKGWYTAETGGTQVVDEHGNIQKNVSNWTDNNGNWVLTNAENSEGGNKLFAHWDGKTFVASFDKNGATSVGKESLSCKVTSGSSCNVILPSITRNGFDIKGWNKNKDKTSGTAVNTEVSLTANVTYYAITSKAVTISFYKNGSLNQMVGETKYTAASIDKKCTIYNVATSCNVTSPVITPLDGFDVIGYHTSVDAHTSTWNMNTEKSVSDSASYYAQTKEDERTITINFHLNGNKSQTKSGGTANTDESVSSSCTIPATYNGITQNSYCNIKSPTISPATGFTVLGYSDDEEDYDVTWEQNTNKNVSGDNDYYAQSKKNSIKYTAKWDKNTAKKVSIDESECTIPAVYNGAVQNTSCTASAPTVTLNANTEFIGFNQSKTATTNDSAYDIGTKKITLESSNNNKTWYAITAQDTSTKKYTITYTRSETCSKIGDCLSHTDNITSNLSSDKKTITMVLPETANWSIEFYKTGSIKVDNDGLYVDAHAVGGGGSGATGAQDWRAGGGGGGYTKYKNEIKLNTSSYAVQVGDGGTAPSRVSATEGKAGTDGSPSKFGTVLTANGGKGGKACKPGVGTCDNSSSSHEADGGAGGSGGGASGLSWNNSPVQTIKYKGGNGGTNGNNGGRGSGPNWTSWGGTTTKKSYYGGTGQGRNTRDFGNGYARGAGGGGRGGYQSDGGDYYTAGGTGGNTNNSVKIGGDGAKSNTTKAGSGTNHYGAGGGAGGGTNKTCGYGKGGNGGSGIVILRNTRYYSKDGKFYDKNDNLIKEKFVYYDTVTYYMKSNGSKHTGWLTYNSKKYYFNSSGVMQVGTQTIGGKSYTFSMDGNCTKGC